MAGRAGKKREARYVDLFCGVGGFRLAVEGACGENSVGARCVFSCDIDPDCRRSYESNFGELPHGDISEKNPADIPDHDILLAGFPCQPFSIIGKRRGFEDTRGTLFFEIAKILAEKRPSCFVLENVKLLAAHDGGRTFARILGVLGELGYHVHHRVLNALDFGLPQKRERIFVVGFRERTDFEWPGGGLRMTPLEELLEPSVNKKHYVSARIRRKRMEVNEPTPFASIWHENKSGDVSVRPYSCALRASASHNYLLVNGERRLTPREMFRLQGFPDSFKIVCADTKNRRHAGNSLPVPVARAVISNALRALLAGRGRC